MSALLERPSPTRPPPPERPAATRPAPDAGHDGLLTLAVVALIVCACLTLTRTYVGLDFLRPVLGGVLVAVSLAWVCRRLGLGSLPTLGVTTLGWVVYCGAVFLSDTMLVAVVPTLETLRGGLELTDRGFELLRNRPAPAFPEPGLLFITVSGVWAITYLVDELVFRLHSPVRAIVVALTLMTIPLALASPESTAWAWAVPFLIAAALLLLCFSGADLARWGTWVHVGDRSATGTGPLAPAGWTMAAVAITAGAVLGGALPGFVDPPWYELRGRGGTTLTTNPIVALRPSLVAQDTGPILRVTSERPVYLRTTALDVYGSAEEWTNSGIRGRPIDGDPLPFEVDIAAAEPLDVAVEVTNLSDAVLVPVPYQPVQVSGPAADAFQYDPRTATFTLDRGTTLETGDRYRVEAAIPSPDPDRLGRGLGFDPGGALTALPDDVPSRVSELAREIVDEAGAATPFGQALAIQEELRSWTYSLDPPPGHSGTAMLTFLETETGYCEQFAGTMAVMLRTLDIPARVAVGFTPGQLVDDSVWEVSSRNAHAWVEVLFPGYGWIAFEPTPRDDGNVLVPTAANLTPASTAAPAGALDLEGPAQEALDFLDPPGADRLPGDGDPNALDEAAGGQGAGAGGGLGMLLPVVLIVGGLSVVGAGLAARRRRKRGGRKTPRGRVLDAVDRTRRLGRGLGVRPGGWETDREFLSRLSAGAPAPAGQAAGTLATVATQVRYGPPAAAVELDTARAAEAAERQLCKVLLGSMSGPRRGLVHARGLVASWAAEAVRRTVRLISGATPDNNDSESRIPAPVARAASGPRSARQVAVRRLGGR